MVRMGRHRAGTLDRRWIWSCSLNEYAPVGSATASTRFGTSCCVRAESSECLYANEIVGSETTVIYTRETPQASIRPFGRLTLHDLALPVRSDATVYICGSTNFTNAASDVVMEAGVAVDRIRVERFGPTG